MIKTTPISCAEIAKRYPQYFIEIIGDSSRTITGVSAPDNSQKDTAVFMSTQKSFSYMDQGALDAAVWVVPPKQKELANGKRGSRTVMISKNVEWSMAVIINDLFLKTPYTNAAIQNVHPSATVSGSATLGRDVRIGPGAFIGEKVKIADRVYIGANSVIEDQTEIGEDTVIHPLVFIGHSTLIGKRCEIHPSSVIAKEGFGYAHDEKGNHSRIAHKGRVVLEDDVHIGGACTIDRATFDETRIQAGAKFDNLCHIGHNSWIGRNSLLTSGFVVAGSTRIGANFVAGGMAAVTGHIEVCDNVQVAAFSAVSKGISKPGAYGGSPLVPLQQFVKTKAATAQLPRMRKELAQIMKHLGLSSAEDKSED